MILPSGGRCQGGLAAGLEARVERRADVSGKLFVVVAKPLFMVAVVEDEVVRGVLGLVVGGRMRLVQQPGQRSSHVWTRGVELGAERLAAGPPTAFDEDALRSRTHEATLVVCETAVGCGAVQDRRRLLSSGGRI